MISQADLDYCVKRGVISKTDKQFFLGASRVSGSLTGHYSNAFNKLSQKLQFYAGISEKVTVMKERVSKKNQLMKEAKNNMLKSYAEANRSQL